MRLRLTLLLGCSLLWTGQGILEAQESDSKQDRRSRPTRNRRAGNDSAPKVGSDAPNFKLKSLDGKSETELATFQGKRPVVLYFGSYT